MQPLRPTLEDVTKCLIGMQNGCQQYSPSPSHGIQYQGQHNKICTAAQQKIHGRTKSNDHINCNENIGFNLVCPMAATSVTMTTMKLMMTQRFQLNYFT